MNLSPAAEDNLIALLVRYRALPEGAEFEDSPAYKDREKILDGMEAAFQVRPPDVVTGEGLVALAEVFVGERATLAEELADATQNRKRDRAKRAARK